MTLKDVRKRLERDKEKTDVLIYCGYCNKMIHHWFMSSAVNHFKMIKKLDFQCVHCGFHLGDTFTIKTFTL